MKKSFLIFLAMLLFSTVAFAHRLNEYLEATTISLANGKIHFEYRLTAGVEIVSDLLKRIDLNGDSRLSEIEQRSYLVSFEHDISLSLDGHYTKLKVFSFSFPTVEDMKKGLGDIIVDFEADLNPNVTSHHLKLKNIHQSAIAVYMVNCLMPADTNIHVINQIRSADQSDYQLNFKTGLAAPGTYESSTSITKQDHYAAVKTYFVHGIRHILTGYDHLLFLCALILGAAGLWDLFKIVTAFTIAHSITLTLATLGYAHLPEYIVEPLIAASIVFVAVQNIVWPDRANGNSRLAVAFLFGLFHGLGFAGGLLELMHAMPTRSILYAILGFSLGVEAGNQLVLLPLYATLQLLKRTQTNTHHPIRLMKIKRFASAVVALAGLYYLGADLYVFLR